MIVSAYGVPGITGIELAYIFQKIGLMYGVVRNYHFLKVDKRQTSNAKKQKVIDAQTVVPVIVYGANTLLRTQHKFQKTKVVVFVIDNPFTLSHTLRIPLLGAEIGPKNNVVYTRIDKANMEEFLAGIEEHAAGMLPDIGMSFKFHNHRPIEEILKKYEESDLSRLQTLLYKIKDVESRNKVSDLTKSWLMTSVPFAKIEAKLQKEVSKPVVFDALKVLLQSDGVTNLRLAIKKVTSGSLTLTKAAKTYKVSAFDLRYLFAKR
jgi:hypothetical protein